MPFRERQDLLTDPVFLIGNGKSRQDFDLERLRSKGTIIGCNALYRDFTPDVLVAIDAKMLKELNESGYGKKQPEEFVIVPKNRTIAIPNAKMWKAERFNTSGCFAMRLITNIMQPSKCYMLGMDGYPGNMFDKTKNYAANTLQNFKGVNGYYLQALQAPGETLFINVNVKDAWPEECHKTGRYKHITYEEFEKTVMGM